MEILLSSYLQICGWIHSMIGPREEDASLNPQSIMLLPPAWGAAVFRSTRSRTTSKRSYAALRLLYLVSRPLCVATRLFALPNASVGQPPSL
jgi:hypothetical protein